MAFPHTTVELSLHNARRALGKGMVAPRVLTFAHSCLKKAERKADLTGLHVGYFGIGYFQVNKTPTIYDSLELRFGFVMHELHQPY